MDSVAVYLGFQRVAENKDKEYKLNLMPKGSVRKFLFFRVTVVLNIHMSASSSSIKFSVYHEFYKIIRYMYVDMKTNRRLSTMNITLGEVLQYIGLFRTCRQKEWVFNVLHPRWVAHLKGEHPRWVSVFEFQKSDEN